MKEKINVFDLARIAESHGYEIEIKFVEREAKMPNAIKPLNENSLAKDVAMWEGRKVEVNIAQIKEVLRITFDCLAQYKMSRVVALIEKHSRESDLV